MADETHRKAEEHQKAHTRSRRACSDPLGNGKGEGVAPGYKGCAICNNDDHYGFGSSVCGRCNRCHGCGSTNNGIGPIQAIYFGGKKVVEKVGEAIHGHGHEKKQIHKDEVPQQTR